MTEQLACLDSKGIGQKKQYYCRGVALTALDFADVSLIDYLDPKRKFFLGDVLRKAQTL